MLPWVLADYASSHLDLANLTAFRDLSRPMGALNAKRLATLQRRFWDMPREEVLDMCLGWIA